MKNIYKHKYSVQQEYSCKDDSLIEIDRYVVGANHKELFQKMDILEKIEVKMKKIKENFQWSIYLDGELLSCGFLTRDFSFKKIYFKSYPKVLTTSFGVVFNQIY